MFDPEIPCEIMETRGCIDADALAAGNAAIDRGDKDEAQRILDNELTADKKCVGVCTRFRRPLDA